MWRTGKASPYATLIYYIFLIALTLLDTSKANSAGLVHGGKGTFLSSLAELSFLTITSHHQSYTSIASLSLHHSGAVTRLVPAPAHHRLSNREHGTRITVQELFGNIPVRLKQRTILCSNKEHEKDWEVLNNNIVGLLLAWNKPLVFTLGSPGSLRKLCIRPRGIRLNISPQILAFPRAVDLSLIRNVLSQAKYIEPSGWSEWIETSIQTDSIAIQGAISLRPAPSKYVQFISLGIHYIRPEVHNILYDLINQIFAGSDFGNEGEFPGCKEPRKKLGTNDNIFEQRGVKTKQTRRGGKGADRWPMFFIRMDLRSQPKLRSRSNLASLEMENTLLNISNALEAVILKFLTNHHFRPRKSQKRKSSLIGGLSKNHTLQNKPLCNGIHNSTISSLSSVSTYISNSECRQKLLQPSLGTFATLPHEGRAVVTAEALGRKIRLPPFIRPDFPRRLAFSHWTRIRSGRAGNTLEFMSRPKLESRQHTPSEIKQLMETEPTFSTGNAEHHVKDSQNGLWAIRKRGEHAANTMLVPVNVNQNLEPENSTISDHDHAVDERMAWTNPTTQAEILINARTGQVARGLAQEPRSNAGSYSQRMQNLDAAAMQDAYSYHTRSPPFGAFETGSWATDFLKTWKNPVFRFSENNAPCLPDDDVGASHTLFSDQRCSDLNIQKPVADSTALISGTLSKKALRDAHVIAQVGRKFILIRMKLYPRKELWDNGASINDQVLVLVDQHAADERVRIEGLLSDLCTHPRLGENMTFPCVHPVSRVGTTVLASSIVFEIQEQEYRLFTIHATHFADWGILYNLHTPHAEDAAKTSPSYKLAIKTLPGGIAERCRMDAKALIELMRREVWRREDDGNKKYNLSETPPTRVTDTKLSAELGSDHWHSQIKNCPQGILDLLNSRSCRSAIMFNDELTHKECLTLIGRLATCIFPFQCAHGRPSMIPVVKLGPNSAQNDKNEVGAMGNGEFGGGQMTEGNFSQAWKRWKKQMARVKDEQVDHVQEDFRKL